MAKFVKVINPGSTYPCHSHYVGKKDFVSGGVPEKDKYYELISKRILINRNNRYGYEIYDNDLNQLYVIGEEGIEFEEDDDSQFEDDFED